MMCECGSVLTAEEIHYLDEQCCECYCKEVEVKTAIDYEACDGGYSDYEYQVRIQQWAYYVTQNRMAQEVQMVNDAWTKLVIDLSWNDEEVPF